MLHQYTYCDRDRDIYDMIHERKPCINLCCFTIAAVRCQGPSTGWCDGALIICRLTIADVKGLPTSKSTAEFNVDPQPADSSLAASMLTPPPGLSADPWVLPLGMTALAPLVDPLAGETSTPILIAISVDGVWLILELDIRRVPGTIYH